MEENSMLGRYELRHVLGQGAMGVVYEGFDPTLSRRVAIKTILQSHALGAETARDYSARFVREAKAAARLNHANIVQVYDFGVEKDTAYIVMEFIQGRELRSFFDQDETFGIEESVRIMCELLDALDFAHEAGVIHRDVKPANVILDAQRRVKLADFGVARIQDSANQSQGGTMVGTPAYMSPEQVTGARVDRRTDIFSAGSILYQFLTGERPFKGAGAWTVSRMVVQEHPPAPSTIASAAPVVFDEVVNKALAKNLDERFPSAREFALALKRGLKNLESASPGRFGTADPRIDASSPGESIGAGASESELMLRARREVGEPRLPEAEDQARTDARLMRDAEEAAREESKDKSAGDAEEKGRKAAEEANRRETELIAKRKANANAKRNAEELIAKQQELARTAPSADSFERKAVVLPRPRAASIVKDRPSTVIISVAVYLAAVSGAAYLMLRNYNAAAPEAVKAVETKAEDIKPLGPCPESYPVAMWTNCVGQLTSASGLKYAGEFRNGMPSGQGRHTFPNGVKYVGQFNDGQRNGQGIEYRADGSVLRSGDWVNDVFLRSR